MSVKYRTIVADPPWNVKFGSTRTMNGVVKPGKWNDPVQDNVQMYDLPYEAMGVDEIAALPIRDMAAPDAHLYLWTINAYIEAAYSIARAWNFQPRTLLTWVKSPMGIGLGGTFTNTTEFVLFCRRGQLKAKRRVDSTWWQWKRGIHSAKPEAFLDLVEQISPGPYLELFARRNRLGWHTWGNECLNHVELETESACS